MKALLPFTSQGDCFLLTWKGLERPYLAKYGTQNHTITVLDMSPFCFGFLFSTSYVWIVAQTLNRSVRSEPTFTSFYVISCKMRLKKQQQQQQSTALFPCEDPTRSHVKSPLWCWPRIMHHGAGTGLNKSFLPSLLPLSSLSPSNSRYL